MRFLDAGESHGKMLTAIIEGVPSNLEIDKSIIDHELSKRQQGFGRGGRMQIEKDEVHIVTGIRQGRTTGAPVTLMIYNKDYESWEHILENPEAEKIMNPRPGHADIGGVLKYDLADIRDVIERSSARETAIRTAVGAFSSILLKNFGITAHSRVIQIGRVKDDSPITQQGFELAGKSAVFCGNPDIEKDMIKEIEFARDRGDTLGGKFLVVIRNVPPGLGSYVHHDRKLDGRLSGAVMSIQGIKAVEIGKGMESSNILGSDFHDEIYYSDNRGFYRNTNNAGGIEGGMSNGEDIIVQAVMKPIPTLKIPLNSVDINSKEKHQANFQRSDTCAVPSASIVGRNVCMWEMACALLEKFGGDSMREVKSNYQNYISYLQRR